MHRRPPGKNSFPDASLEAETVASQTSPAAMRPPETEFARGIRYFGMMITWITMLRVLFVLLVNIRGEKQQAGDDCRGPHQAVTPLWSN